jgi:N-acetylglucosamine-6-sulfatase
VAAIVDALSRTGRLANSAIIFTSDNGFAHGAHRWRAKNCVYEECARVPLLVRMPGVVVPRTDTRLVSSVDIAPTIAEWAGATPAVTFDGRSLVGLLIDPLTPWRTELLIETFGWSKNTLEHYATSRRSARASISMPSTEMATASSMICSLILISWRTEWLTRFTT